MWQVEVEVAPAETPEGKQINWCDAKWPEPPTLAQSRSRTVRSQLILSIYNARRYMSCARSASREWVVDDAYGT